MAAVFERETANKMPLNKLLRTRWLQLGAISDRSCFRWGRQEDTFSFFIFSK